MTSRRRLLAALFVAVGLLTAAVLFEVLGTVFFAVTVGVVLLPLRRRLAERGYSDRVAAAAVTAAGFAAVVLLLSPIGFVLYRRRGEIFRLLRTLPDEFTVPLFGIEYVIETAPLVTAARNALQAYAVAVASAAPVLALKLFLFAFLVYALLLRPDPVGRAVFRMTPPAYHDVARALHRRIRRTLFAIYVVQGATAAGTFAVAYGLFWALGYDSALALAVVAGVLQFVPIVGPSLVIGALAAMDVLLLGMPNRAIMVLAAGLLLVGFVPDALLRPQLAGRAGHIPASLYFIGFVGGVLTVGPVGIIAGPVVVGLFVETVSLLSDEMRLETTA